MIDTQVEKIVKLAEGESRPHGVYFLNTKQELKNFYLEGLGIYKEWKAIASIEDWLPVDSEFLQDFRQQLDQKEIHTKVIFKESGLQYEPEGLQHREVRVIPTSYQFRSSIDILPDKLLVMNPKLKVLGLVVEIESILDIFNDIFDLLWETLPKPKG